MPTSVDHAPDLSVYFFVSFPTFETFDSSAQTVIIFQLPTK